MGKKSFAICDSNEVYAKKLYEYFFVKESESYEMLLFTDRTQLDDYVKKKPIDLLLLDESLIREDEIIDNTNQLMILCSDESRKYKQGESLYKYRSGDCLLKEVMHYYSVKNEECIQRRKGKELVVIGIYSPIKRCFQTSFAITLGQILAQNSKTIYLNFESFSGFDIMRKMDSKQDMSDLMYFLECGGDNFTLRLQSMINRIGDLHFISPNHSYLSQMNIKGEGWLKLIRFFESYTDYQYLVLDLSENMMGLFDLLRECSHVYTIVAKDNVSKAKLLQYEKLLEEGDYSDVIEKTRKINIPTFKEIPLEYEILPFSELARYAKNQLKEDKII